MLMEGRGTNKDTILCLGRWMKSLSKWHLKLFPANNEELSEMIAEI